MKEKEITTIINFLKTNKGKYPIDYPLKDDNLVPWDILADKFGEDKIEELLERGLIYEPILGYVKDV